jgi:hypothetical protein
MVINFAGRHSGDRDEVSRALQLGFFFFFDLADFDLS